MSNNNLQTTLQTHKVTKKKQTKNTPNKLKSPKKSKLNKISPGGLKGTLSTESCSSGLVGSAEKDTAGETGLNSISSKGSISKEDILRKQAKDSLQMLEHKNNHIHLLGKRFKIEDELLGFGSFGRTYLGKDIKRDRHVAIKIMLRKKSMDLFLKEARVLKSVNYIKAGGFPKMLMSAYNEDICILVEELLGVNLETLRKRYGRLSFGTTATIGIQLLNRLESLHQCGFIHRDIKPQNILLGGGDTFDKSNMLFLIDFGLAQEYLDDKGEHYIPQSQQQYSTVVGTALFASVNAHQGRELSRRDDIESMIYTLIYLCAGTLPWKNINIKKKKERHQIIMYLKEEISSNQEIQSTLNVPYDLFQMLQYTQQLQFDEEPDYTYLKTLLQKVIKKNYPHIKKMKEIDIMNNNFEDTSVKQPSSQAQTPKASQDIGIIDVSQIAFQVGFNCGAADGLQSIASNEQLVFKSEIDGRTNNMNTNDKEDANMKLNPAMYRSLFAAHTDEIGKMNRVIPQIKEEDDESESSNESEEEYDDNEESKDSKKYNEQDKIDEEECEDDEEDMEDDDDFEENEIPDDLEVSTHIQGYYLEAKDHRLSDKKGHNFQSMSLPK